MKTAIPTFIPLAEHRRIVAERDARIARLEAENAELRARIERVRALLRQRAAGKTP